jgi:hypothetical protein
MCTSRRPDSCGAKHILFLTLCLPAGGVLLEIYKPLSAAEVTVERVADAWAKYQQHIVSAKFTWTERTLVAKDSFQVFGDLPSNGQPIAVSNFPNEDTAFQGLNTLTIEGDHWRYESQIPVLDSSRNLVLQNTVNVSKGGISKSYMLPGGRDVPSGAISEAKPSDVPRINAARPLFLIFRSLGVGLFNPQEYVIAPMVGSIDDRPCTILQTEPTSSRWSLWVDPARDYSILRYTLASEGKVLLTADIAYNHSDEHGWVPKGWTIVNVDRNGKLKQSITAVVTKWQINDAIDPNEFELEFPPGTSVQDFRKQIDGHTTHYIVPVNEEKGQITRPNRDMAPEPRLPNATAEAPMPHERTTSWTWSIVLIAAVLLTCLAIVTWRKRLGK